jgi:hypothetical protein
LQDARIFGLKTNHLATLAHTRCHRAIQKDDLIGHFSCDRFFAEFQSSFFGCRSQVFLVVTVVIDVVMIGRKLSEQASSR